MRQERIDANSLELNEKVVSIKRVTKVVKGGRNMRFTPAMYKREYPFLKEVDSLALANVQRIWKRHIYHCECGNKMDRDHNATINIREEVRRMLTA